MTTDAYVVVLPTWIPPAQSPVTLVARLLEAELLTGPMPQPRQLVRDAQGLVPVVTAVQVRWRHTADLDQRPVIGVIADAVDTARSRVATARTLWPLSPVPMGEVVPVPRTVG